MERPLLVNTSSLANYQIDDALHQWNVVRATFAVSLRTYLDAFSHFEIVCTQLHESKERDIPRPDVRAAIDDEALILTPQESSIISTRRKLLQLKNISKLTSPIATLPVEVLSRIFIFAVESCRICDAGPHRSALLVHQVNAISSACSSWRRIALSTAQL
ncbi:hypothetical protein BDV93DRAFT_529307, partial [Ceratobasidium sp. AG-I]